MSVVKRFAVFFVPTGSHHPRSGAESNIEAGEKDEPLKA